MKILFQHDGILPIKKYGGTERIIFWHIRRLIKLGHKVSLIGSIRSIELEKLGVKLIAKNQKDWRPLIPPDTDIVHLFYTPEFDLDIPYIVTIEGNGHPGEKFKKNTAFISKKHAEIHSGNYFVYNGIDLEDYPHPNFSDKKFYANPSNKNYWNHFSFLAKAKWKVKNVKGAVTATQMAKKHLHIAGGRVFSLSSYTHSYGMVDQNDKIKILRQSSALIFPVRWHEPFGIAIIEAFSQGLPVIGTPYGSLPELINNKTGIICNNIDELIDAVFQPTQAFDPEEIRDYVEEILKHKELSHLVKKDADHFIGTMLDCIKRAVKKGDNVSLIGFGTFTKVRRAARIGMNPSTGKKIRIKAKTVPKFRPGQAFKASV
ncbi:MAG: HU family DNA-binding protein [Oligoflexia bacterium]|nr:HU family DNA-binding protein [Oligoflexia bacterium]